MKKDEKKNEVFSEVVKNLPGTSTITYEKKPTEEMSVPYTLTVKGYTKMFLDSTPLEDLNLQEQLILLNSNPADPAYTPEKTVAGIYKAREIQKRSKSISEAIAKCNKALIKENQAWLHARSVVSQKISDNKMRASMLEYYLKAEKAVNRYNRVQESIFSPIINFKDRIVAFFKRKPYGKPPFPASELEQGRKEWKKFRIERKAPDNMSDKEVLKRFKYNSSEPRGEAFSYMYSSPQIKALAEEYTTTNIALKIIDGSAYAKAEETIMKNPFQYLRFLKDRNEAEESKTER